MARIYQGQPRGRRGKAAKHKASFTTLYLIPTLHLSSVKYTGDWGGCRVAYSTADQSAHIFGSSHYCWYSYNTSLFQLYCFCHNSRLTLNFICYPITLVFRQPRRLFWFSFCVTNHPELSGIKHFSLYSESMGQELGQGWFIFAPWGEGFRWEGSDSCSGGV